MTFCQTFSTHLLSFWQKDMIVFGIQVRMLCYILLASILHLFSVGFLCSSVTADAVLFPTAGLCECSS